MSENSKKSYPHWKEFDFSREIWKMRIKQMAGFIEEEKSVVDMGCGNQWLKEMLPADIKYYPVDCISRDKDVLVCDFNNKEFPQITADCAFCSGVLEYLSDLDWFAEKLCTEYPSLIISYFICEKNTEPHPARQNFLTWDEVEKLFISKQYHLVKYDFYEVNTKLFKFKR